MSTAAGKTGLRAAGGWLLAGSGLWWVAAAVAEEEFFLGDSALEKASAIAAEVGAFRAFHLIAGLGTVVATVGLVLLSRRLRSRRPGRLVDVAVSAAVVGTVAWLAEIAIRITSGVDRARAAAAGTAPPGGEPSVGNVAVFAVAGLAFVAPLLVAWVLASRRVPGRWSSLAIAGLVTLVTAVAAATIAVSMVYQFGTLAMGAALLSARRPGPEAVAAPDRPATPTTSRR